ncbi:MAG: sensor histidine kinase KdpD [Anaerolineales bacterium]|nr:sensor histidine kinase KdpD [Anaerolineales bacterium]
MTNDDARPDPDYLLAAIQKTTVRKGRGKLKLFLGMAAGVGKTYAMLDSAQRLHTEGIDVVVGYVETHRRPETDALLVGLSALPRRQIDYRGARLEEMDIDAILARRPEIVLVDELAHTNAPESRHVKRYQDVIELLEAGITVYTTMNVQHFESRVDAVRQITGITVHETVPDSILDYVTEIELIDLSPEDLRKRLAEGRVYVPDKVETAITNFFRTGNLTALREMALRLTAEHVDHQLQDYMEVKRIAGPWKSGERLMVAVSPSPFAEKLIRWTRRIAYNLEAPWLAVYVQSSRALTAKENAGLAQNLALARELGAEVITAAGEDVVGTLVRLAQQQNVTQIVVGKPLQNRWQTLLRGGSLVDALLRRSGNIDIYVITGDETANPTAPTVILPLSPRHSTPRQYVLALAIVIGIAAVDYLLRDYIGYFTVGLTEILAVLLIAIYIGRGPAFLAAMISAISWNFLFIEPRFTFIISQQQDVLLVSLYFIIALFAGNMTARLRLQERQARYNAERTMALYALAHETATAVNMADVLRTAIDQIGRVFTAEVAILLPEGGILPRTPHPLSTLPIDDKEFGVALWSFEKGKPAGRFTDTLPFSSAVYMPLRTPNRTVGVIGIRTRQTDRLSFDQEVLLETFISQVALVVERELLDEAAAQAAMLQESERLYTTLLNSISHELRTPLATISGAASGLSDPQTSHNEHAHSTLINDIQEAADRLNHLVENLLDMSRLDSGKLHLKREWCDLNEVIGVALQRMARRLARHPLTLKLSPTLPLIQLDFVLMEQVFVNLLNNLCNYTPEGTAADITTSIDGSALLTTLRDYGRGVPEGALGKLFEKFYRVPGTATGGSGLGLSISQGIVEAHEGTLTARNATMGGLELTIRLPLGGDAPPVREAAL